MCTKIAVCHGDKATTLGQAYTQAQRDNIPQGDCEPSKFYITSDGKYAIDADFVSAADLNDPDFDYNSVPKIKLA